MAETAAEYVVETLGYKPEDIAEALDLGVEEVRSYLAREGEGEEGMPPRFIRDLAWYLGIHRAHLLDPNWTEGPSILVDRKDNSTGALDGRFGRLLLSFPTPGRPGEINQGFLTLSQSATSDLAMPLADQPVNILGFGMLAHILIPDAVTSFSIEEVDAEPRRINMPPEMEAGVNPEILLSAYEVFKHDRYGEGDNPRSEMSEALLAEVEAYLGRAGGKVEEWFTTVRVRLRDGTGLAIQPGPTVAASLAGLFRFTSEGRLPPFLLLVEEGFLRAIPMHTIAMISFPWMMIADLGAHVDLDLGEPLGEEEPEENEEDDAYPIGTHRAFGEFWGPPGDYEDDEEEDIVTLTSDLLPSKAD